MVRFRTMFAVSYDVRGFFGSDKDGVPIDTVGRTSSHSTDRSDNEAAV